MKDLVIFGAKSIALGAGMAIRELYPDCRLLGFMVSCREGNPDTLCGLPVRETGSYTDKTVCVLVATPEDVQEGIVKSLAGEGFRNVICLDSARESGLMRQYYGRMGRFPALKETKAEVYMAKSHKDRPLKGEYEIPDWVYPIQAGAALTSERVALLADSSGENISAKNGNYSELTVLYWIWKNRLCREGSSVYYGLYHYRRILDISEWDLQCPGMEGVDVVLPYPMVCEPSVLEHHERYVGAADWNALMQALAELYPDYSERSKEIFRQKYMYNYNIILARKDVLKDYCEWLFSVLERTEELLAPESARRSDRYIGYLGESLLSLYFLYNKQAFRIRHTGRLMLV